MTVVTYKNVKRPIINPGDLPMLALFARGEQGAWYDPSDIYNYCRYGAVAPDFRTWNLNGTAALVEDGVHVTGLSTPNGISFSGFASTGKWYEYMIRVDTTVGAAVLRGPLGTLSLTRQGPNQVYRGVVQAVNNGAFQITSHASMESDFIIREVLIREVTTDSPTMFQDAEGTIPVTSVEQPVGLILDKSGNGNHASQLTTTARPHLSARVNFASYSEAPTGSFGSSTSNVVPTTVNAPFGEATGVRKLTGGTSYSYASLDGSLGGTVTVSYYVRRLDGEPLNFGAPSTPTSGTNDCTISVGGARAPEDFTIQPMEGGWYRISATRTDYESGSLGFLSYNVAAELEVTGLQIEHGGVATSYQRTNTSSDYDWQGWPLYLEIDGVDDTLSAILPSGLPANIYLAEVLDRRGQNFAIVATKLAANSGPNDYVDIFLQTSHRIQARACALSIGIDTNRALTNPETVPLNTPSVLEVVSNPIPGNLAAGANGVDYPIGSPPGVSSNIPAGTVLGTQTTFDLASTFPTRRYGAVALWRVPSADERAAVRKFLTDKSKVPA